MSTLAGQKRRDSDSFQVMCKKAFPRNSQEKFKYFPDLKTGTEQVKHSNITAEVSPREEENQSGLTVHHWHQKFSRVNPEKQ